MNLLSERIKLARSLCHFSMDELVRRMGERAVSKMAISKFERGLMKPTPTTLQAIADACHVPLTFFSQPMPLLSQLEYRFDLSISPEQLQHIDSIVAPLLQNYFGIQTILGSDLTFVHPLPNNPLCNYADAEHAAIELRRKWEIGLQPIHSVYELLCCYGVHVIEADLGANQVFGLSTFVRASASSKGDIPIIIINACACATTERKRFTALHELCHLLFPLRPGDEVGHGGELARLRAPPPPRARAPPPQSPR
ncbi:MAG: ImmA/IrrE family metallo-endopeptidase, partial [Bacteroidales bacterium]|nr:ImmA/IrrE family metallo-endopeptidase [Candidatus Physcousia equi]